MKIDEILNEGVLGGIAGAAKGAVKGAVQGYKAGAAPVEVEPPEGYEPPKGSTPSSAMQRFGTDLASAIRAGASGDISARTATTGSVYPAPVGTQIHPWVKDKEGWLNKNKNRYATPAEAGALDSEWNKYVQKHAGEEDKAGKAAQLAQAEQPEQPSVSTQPEQQSASTQPEQPAQITIPPNLIIKNKPWTIKTNKTTVTRNNEGYWNTSEGEEIVNAADLKKLNYYADLGVNDVDKYMKQSKQKEKRMIKNIRQKEKAIK